jgi:tetratricopeptide (TPR) repeat protein
MLRAYLSSAAIYSIRGDYASASRSLDQSIAHFPTNSDLTLQKGDLYLSYNRTDSAIYFYQKTLQLNPKRIDAHLRKINIYLNKWKSYYLAMIEYTAIKAIDPDYEEINIKIAQTYENMGNLYRAKEYYALEIEKYPESKVARYGLWKIKQKEAGLLTEGEEENGTSGRSSKTLDSLKVNIAPLERLRPGDF